MINEMIMASETDIVVICDADVIVPEKQLNEAMALMLEGEVDVLYPFNSFVKLNRIQTSSLMSSMNYDSYSSIGGMHSVGGMIFFKKSSYMEGGMENEKFMVWGYEDVERYERFRKLGYNIVRLDGNLYHLHHHIGPNSSRLNPFFGSNKAEYEKVLKMDKEQLLDYIETWGWRF
jgi:predicted glycosyltransferase involved in capsule biosynthesis